MKKKFTIALFFLYFLLVSGLGIFLSIKTMEFKMLVLHLAHGFFLAYIFTFLNDQIKAKSVRIVLKILLITILSLSFLTDIFCFIEFDTTFTEDFLAIVLGSDPSESSEFLALHSKGFFLGSLIWLIILLSGLILQKFTINLPQKIYFGSALLLIPCALLININANARDNLLLENGAEGKFFTLSRYIKEMPPNYKHFIKPANLEIIAEQPDNIVIVFGESHNRSHCQFYGYDKVTMPEIQKYIDNGHIQTFGNVTSPDINTQKVFKCLMSTYIPEYKDSIPFYTCQTLPQVCREAGYRSYWISNQSKRGFYDNIIGNFADLCDTTFFNGDKFSGMFRKNLDGELLSVVDSLVKNNSPNKKNFYLIHLMGSHPGFKDRYPSTMQYFSDNDYFDKPANQRFYFATYDNSIRYTDKVLSDIIQSFQDKEAIIIYLSDHGLDFFVTQNDYCSHALSRDTESGRVSMEVPFLVYTSDLFQQHFPVICERLRSNSDFEYRSDSLIYTIMDIAGVIFRDSTLNHGSILQ